MGVVKPAPCRIAYRRRVQNTVVRGLPIAPEIASTAVLALGRINPETGKWRVSK
jgi:hypothetical protein